MPAATYSIIASNTLTATSTTVTFSSISTAYTDLVLRATTRGSTTTGFGASVGFTLNGVTSNVYSHTGLTGDGTNAASDRSGTSYWNGLAGRGNDAGNTANTFTSIELYIPNYQSSILKTGFRFDVAENNTVEGWLGFSALLWDSTAAITSLTVMLPSGGHFLTNSSFFLYGIKNS